MRCGGDEEVRKGRVAPLLAPIVVLASAVFVHFVIESTGYRTPAVPPGTPEDEARATSTQAFGASQFKRMLPAEVPALVAVALAYATVDGGFFTYCTGALASIVLMALHAWPGEIQIAKVQASLERDGGDSYLREVLAG